jgi:high-affinity nickel permease
MNAPLAAALTSAAVLGFRHGFDHDHIAAITDLTSMQPNARAAIRLATVYALGHAFTVAALGSAVIAFQLTLPQRIDRLSERLVGLTLIVLGLYVISCLVSGKHSHLRLSRVALVVSGLRWINWKVRSFMRRDLPGAEVFRWNYNGNSAFLIGMIHGLSAETPTQIVVFLLAANLGGLRNGFLALAIFLTGLLTMNTLMTAAAAGIYSFSVRKPALLRAVSCMTAAYSVGTGVVFLFGASSLLPRLGGQ